MPPSKKIDYDRIEADWRVGIKSPRQMAEEYTAATGVAVTHAAIINHFKRLGIERDLSAKVKAKADSLVTKAMVTGKVTSLSNEKEVVLEAAICHAEVQLTHRKDLAKLRKMEEKLLEDLGGEDMNEPTKLYITQYQGQIVQKEVGLTVSEKASTLLALANVRGKRIELERKAFNMDGDRGDEGKGDGLAGLIAEIHANSRRGLPSEER